MQTVGIKSKSKVSHHLCNQPKTWYLWSSRSDTPCGKSINPDMRLFFTSGWFIVDLSRCCMQWRRIGMPQPFEKSSQGWFVYHLAGTTWQHLSQPDSSAFCPGPINARASPTIVARRMFNYLLVLWAPDFVFIGCWILFATHDLFTTSTGSTDGSFHRRAN